MTRARHLYLGSLYKIQTARLATIAHMYMYIATVSILDKK